MHIIHFSKMHGLGNDFMVINSIEHPVDPAKLPIKKLANRFIGVGFDQLLIIEPSKKADFFCRIFNSDGSEAEQCGNGLRCVARLIHEKKLTNNSHFTIETAAGVFPIDIIDYDHVRVSMGPPKLINNLVTLHLPNHTDVAVSILSMGNPHAVVKVETIKSNFPDQVAPHISAHSLFPNGTNVGFMQIVNKDHIRLRTFERGAGETLACGSNACAAVAAGIANDWLDEAVSVEYGYGKLLVEWKGKDNSIQMTGPASLVYSGDLDQL